MKIREVFNKKIRYINTLVIKLEIKEVLMDVGAIIPYRNANFLLIENKNISKGDRFARKSKSRKNIMVCSVQLQCLDGINHPVPLILTLVSNLLIKKYFGRDKLSHPAL